MLGLLCRLTRNHSFGKWTPAEEPCEQTRHCRRDGIQERRVLHAFGDWHDTDNPCEQRRTCRFCPATETAPYHRTIESEKYGGHITDFQSWKETTVYKCSNCSYTETTEEHFW